MNSVTPIRGPRSLVVDKDVDKLCAFVWWDNFMNWLDKGSFRLELAYSRHRTCPPEPFFFGKSTAFLIYHLNVISVDSTVSWRFVKVCVTEL